MYADQVTFLVRQTADRSGGPVVELFAFRFSPDEGDFDPTGTTDALRQYTFSNGGVAFTFEERRHWTDAGASGAGVEFVLELLGSGAAGVAIDEIYRYARSLFAKDSWEEERYEDTSDDELRTWMLDDIERHLGLRRGTLTVEEFARSADHAYLVVAVNDDRNLRYGARRSSDGDFHVRALH